MSGVTNRFILRPLELKHIFDFTLRIYRANFVPMFLAMAMVQLPLALLWLPVNLRIVQFFNEFAQDPEQMFDGSIFNQLDLLVLVGAVMLTGAVYQLLVWPLGALTCSKLAVQTLLNEPISFRDAFAHARRRYWPTQVALATYALPVLVLSVIVLLPVLAFQGSGSEGALLTSALIALMLINIGMFVMGLLFFRFYPALLGSVQSLEAPEGRGMLGNGIWYLKRAWGLTGGHGMRSFGYFFLLGIAIYFVQSGLNQSISLIVLIVTAFGAGEPNMGEILNAMQSSSYDPMLNGITMLLGSIFALIYPPIQIAFSLLLYTDLRCRKEGLDIQIQIKRMPKAKPPQPELP